MHEVELLKIAVIILKKHTPAHDLFNIKVEIKVLPIENGTLLKLRPKVKTEMPSHEQTHECWTQSPPTDHF